MNLIDRDEFIADIETENINLYMDGFKGTPRPREISFVDLIDRIEEQPIIDVKPIKYGHWIEEPLACNGDNIIRCSACNRAMIIGKQIGTVDNYCPNCGAKMYEEIDK